MSSDLESLASHDGAAIAAVLRDVLREVQFDQVNHDLRLRDYGGDYLVRPFPLPGSPVDVANMKTRLRHVARSAADADDRRFARRIELAFTFLMFGEPLNRRDLEELVGSQRVMAIDRALQAGLFVSAGAGQIRMDGLSVFSRRLPRDHAVYLVADTPPHFTTRSGPQRVYAGADSYELMQRVAGMEPVSGHCVEMGSGSGIQLITALRCHPGIVRAIGVERDRRARYVSLFNTVLNQVEDRVAVVSDEAQLRGLLGSEQVSFGMSNPPFLALPASIPLDAESRALLSNVRAIHDTADGSLLDVEAAFPQAGWGGEDGLQVTRQFLEVLFALQAPGGTIVLYSQFAGDESGPSRIRTYVEQAGGFECTFDPVMSADGVARTARYGASESATTVARLLTAALMAQQQPHRVRLAVRAGGPEHVLMQKLAGQIEASYARAGITHFHDGFLTLVRHV
jgi:methylase of polypeptide subunit release factors